MGLSIHYNGSFKKGASLSEMVEEVSDIAEVHKWKCTVFNTSFPDVKSRGKEHDGEIYGVCFSPPECEPVWLTFLSNGRMSSLVGLQLFGNSEKKEEKEYLYMLSTKTQYAGIEVHILIIHLMKYISGKYLDKFTLSDEGKYWETGDRKLLESTFGIYNELLNSVANALQTITLNKGETFEQYLERILKEIHDKRKK